MKKIKHSIVLVFIVLMNLTFVEAQYYLHVCIEGAQNEKVLLAGFYGKQLYPVDSAIIDTNGKAIFENKNKVLPQGQYTLMLSSTKVDFLIGETQNLSISFSTKNADSTLHIEGDTMANAFIEFMKYFNTIHHQLENVSIHNEDEKQKLESAFEQYIKTEIDKYPQSVYAQYLSLLQKPTIVEKDFSKRHIAWINQFFSNVDFHDSRFIRIPYFEDRLDFYFNQLLPQNSDSLISYCDKIIAKCEEGSEMYQFVLRYLFQNYYAKFDKKNDEACFMHIVDNYYLKGKAFWVKEKFLSLLSQRVEKMRTTLYGVQIPNIILETPEGKKVELYSIKSPYTVLYFYEYDCGFCSIETPKLMDITKQFKGKVEVVGIYMRADKEQWAAYIKAHKLSWINLHDPKKEQQLYEKFFIQQIPHIILLDKNKTVLEKKINTSQLEQILKQSIQ